MSTLILYFIEIFSTTLAEDKTKLSTSYVSKRNIIFSIQRLVSEARTET